MSNPGSAAAAARLAAAFSEIHRGRMQGLPFLHPGLEVEAVGFRPWNGDWLGVLITPWFMNVILLPGPDARWEVAADGAKVPLEFPSGRYEFFAAAEPDLGPYRSLPLFAPMQVFEDQRMAREVASLSLASLLGAKPADAASPVAPGRMPIGSGTERPRNVSRRDFFRRFAPDDS